MASETWAVFPKKSKSLPTDVLYLLSYRIDFEDTYDGLGDQLSDDQDEFNDDTLNVSSLNSSWSSES
jgi:hypothetical protein